MSQADDLQRRAEAFADQSIRFVEGLPDTLIARRLGAQYLDSSTSVAANYRAARKGRSHDEFTAKVGLVCEEADESVFWLKRITNARIRSSVAIEPLLAEAEERPASFRRLPERRVRAAASVARMTRRCPDEQIDWP